MKSSSITAVAIIIVVLILVVGGWILWRQSGDSTNSETSTQSTTENSTSTKSSSNTSSSNTTSGSTSTSDSTASSSNSSTTSGSQESTFTEAEVAEHSTSSDCWTIVNGDVYDLTSFVSRHPGGVARITQICGVDGTSEFSGQHGGESRPQSELSSLKIGALQ